MQQIYHMGVPYPSHTIMSWLCGLLLVFFLPCNTVMAQKAHPDGENTGEQCDKIVMQWLNDRWNIDHSDNNRIVIFKKGQEKFDDLFKAIKQAKHSIHLEYFNFRNDSISKALFDLLAERVAAGVKVRALFDGFGNSSNNRPLKKEHLDTLRKKGIDIYEFDPFKFPWITKAMHRDHRKIVVIDGVVAYTGGMNVADYYIKGKPEFGEWRDIHCRIEGDAVARLQGIFINFWNQVTGENIGGTEYYPGERDASTLFQGLAQDTARTAGHKEVAVVNRKPGTDSHVILDTFVKLIQNAKKQILIINPYFTLYGDINKELRRAIDRGVDVEIMVSEKSDIPITPRIVEYYTHKLAKRGAKVFVFQGGFHHSKIMMVDGQCSFIGSANLNSRSMVFDYECNLFIKDSATTETLTRIFMEDKATRCFPLTPESRKKMSPWTRMKGWMFHFLSPVVEEKFQPLPDGSTLQKSENVSLQLS